MAKKIATIGLYLAALVLGVFVCRGRTIPLDQPTAPLRSAQPLLPATLHSVHTTPTKHTGLSRRRIA